jgi:beta-glucosidase
MLGGEAIARILFGEAVPMGKLTVSFPKSVGQNPIHYQQIPGWHGSKHGHYDPEPLFPFGFGLSYTRFDYSNLRLEQTRVGRGQDVVAYVDVENVGQRSGTEVAQLYLNDVFTALSTPSKTLKAFLRVELAPGQRQTLRFVVPFAELAYAGQNGEPVFEPGDFDVRVGGSSRDEDLLTARFVLAL